MTARNDSNSPVTANDKTSSRPITIKPSNNKTRAAALKSLKRSCAARLRGAFPSHRHHVRTKTTSCTAKSSNTQKQKRDPKRRLLKVALRRASAAIREWAGVADIEHPTVQTPAPVLYYEGSEECPVDAYLSLFTFSSQSEELTLEEMILSDMGDLISDDPQLSPETQAKLADLHVLLREVQEELSTEERDILQYGQNLMRDNQQLASFEFRDYFLFWKSVYRRCELFHELLPSAENALANTQYHFGNDQCQLVGGESSTTTPKTYPAYVAAVMEAVVFPRFTPEHQRDCTGTR